MAELPLTVTGKIRRGELRRLDAERRAAAERSRPEARPVELEAKPRFLRRDRRPVAERRAAAAEQVRRVERVAARERGVERLDDRAGRSGARWTLTSG